MKPHIKPGWGLLWGISFKCWWCQGDNIERFGATPREAYENWRQACPGQSRNPLNRFQRWVLQHGDWR